MTAMRNGSGRFTTGNPGGPGRPKGSKHKLSEAFVAALAQDFEEHGTEAIRRVCENDPSTYLRVIASLVPKDFQVSSSSVLDQFSDDELAEWVALLREAKVAREQDEDRPERLQ